jgi:radical SAM protein with 4Fe4S-binding SPASM domain
MRVWNRAKLLWGYLARRPTLPALPIDHGQVQPILPDMPARDPQTAKTDMTHEVFQHVVRETRDAAEYMMLIGLGEPFMDPAIFDRIEFCHRNSISTLLSTNGTLLDERMAARVLDSPLSQITLSFDGAKKETYEFYRKGAKFEKVRNNFVRFARMKHERRSKLQIIVQMVTMERNAAEVSDFIAFWSTIPGVDQLRIKADETNLMSPDVAHPAEHWNNPCHYLWRGPIYVKHNGDVYPCCQSYMLNGTPLGNVKKRPLVSIWNSEGIERMRRLHGAGRGAEIDVCSRCRTPIPHPALVIGSIALPGRIVRGLLPWVMSKLPSRLLRAPQRVDS